MSIARILIVADARETVDELRDFFEENGYETEVALNSKVASAILEERRMDLTIIGFKVQDVQCLEILENLRKIDSFMPVFVMQGNNTKRIKTLVKRAGAQDYIPEPINKISFLEKVKKILASHTSNVGSSHSLR